MNHGRSTQLQILIFISIISTYTSAVLEECSYPDTLYDIKFHWRIMSPDHTLRLRHYRRKVVFNNSEMQMDYITHQYKWHPSGKTIIYKCNQKLDEQKFIVSVQENNEDVHYTCIQFILRGLNVVQLKFGPKHRQKSKKLCNEESLQLMDAPMVYYYGKQSYWTEPRNRKSKYNACPLSGGYVLTQWYNETKHAMCKASRSAPISIKVENECEKGEGLGFLGGSRDCPQIYPGYPFFCMADWTEGNYTYMVLFREHIDFDLPCFKYKTNHENTFTADLFMDGVCDTTEDASISRKIRHMVLERHSDVKADLCSNDSPVCNQFLPPQSGCGWSWASFCRYTCHTCPWRRAWENATIPTQYRGVFLKDTYKLGKETVIIDEHYVKIPSLGKYRVFGQSSCVDNKYLYAMGDQVKEFVFIQSFDNGCSPRMSLIQLAVRSPYVISIRLSVPRAVDWKLFQDLSIQPSPEYGRLACMAGTKFQKPAINIKETFRTLPYGWFNLVQRKDTLEKEIVCKLPPYSLFEISLYPQTTCQGHIKRLSGESFQVTFETCHGDGLSDSIVREITSDVLTMDCLASFKEKSGRLTDPNPMDFALMRFREKETIHNMTHVCWTFSITEKNTVYWSHVSDCDSNGEVYFFEYEGGVKQYIGIMTEAIQPLQKIISAAEVQYGHGAISLSVLPLIILFFLT